MIPGEVSLFTVRKISLAYKKYDAFSCTAEKSEPQIHQNPVFSMENSEKRDFGNIYT